MKIRSSLSR